MQTYRRVFRGWGRWGQQALATAWAGLGRFQTASQAPGSQYEARGACQQVDAPKPYGPGARWGWGARASPAQPSPSPLWLRLRGTPRFAKRNGR